MSFKLKWLYSTNIFLIYICSLHLIAAVPPTPEKSEETDNFEKECKELKGRSEGLTETEKQKSYGCLPYITGNLKGTDPYIPQMETFYLIEPPPDVPKTLVKVTKLEMGNFHVLGESDFRPDIELEIKITWTDSRLKWDKNVWIFDTYPVELKPLSTIWGPKFNQKSASQGDLLFELFSYYEPVVTSTGNVSATLGAQLVFSKCKIDVSKFPYDDIKCCTDFSVNAQDNKVILETEGAQLSWDTTTGGIWEVLFLTLETKRNEAHNGGKPSEIMDFCVVARRNTKVLGMELSMPMGVSAIVMMCAQLAGKWKMQVYVKMFALFLQVFSFQTLIPNEAMSVATKLPRIYQFYNFTVGITIFSLIQTMIFWALSRRWFMMPPPHKIVLCMKAVSRFMLGESKQTTSDNSDTGNVENPPSSKSASNGYRKEWEVIFATMHAVLSVIIIIAYIIGVIIIYAG